MNVINDQIQVYYNSQELAPVSLPPKCRQLYLEIMNSIWINRLNKDLLNKSIPIIDIIYQSNGNVSQLERPLSLVAYACFAVESMKNSSHKQRCDDFMLFKYLTAAMLYNTMQDNASVLSAKQIINLFDIQIPKGSWWWEFFDRQMYNIPVSLVESPQGKVFSPYSSFQLPYIRVLDDYARIIFGLSILNDIEKMAVAIDTDWLKNVLLIVFSRPLDNMDGYDFPLNSLYNWILARIRSHCPPLSLQEELYFQAQSQAVIRPTEVDISIADIAKVAFQHIIAYITSKF
jgi:hypothetical protein